jgi:hypothetical protein
MDKRLLFCSKHANSPGRDNDENYPLFSNGYRFHTTTGAGQTARRNQQAVGYPAAATAKLLKTMQAPNAFKNELPDEADAEPAPIRHFACLNPTLSFWHDPCEPLSPDACSPCAVRIHISGET